MSDSTLPSLDEFDPEFLALVEAYCSGTISADGQQRLDARLQSDQAALEAFVVYLDFHSRLQRWASRSCSVCNPILTFGETDSGPLANQPPEAGLFGGSKAVWTAFFLASISFVAMAYWLFRSAGDGGNNQIKPAPVVAKQDSSSVDASPPQSLTSVRSIRFDSGIATIGLDKIGTVVIEGPADFLMLSPMRARLAKGKIKVRVSEPTGRGFQVETPNGLVTDLGTEFLLNVSEAGKTNLAVIEGKVDFQVSLSAKENQVVVGPDAERLSQGDGLSIDARGNVDRIMSINRSTTGMFNSDDELEAALSKAVIVKVEDNLGSAETKRFYEIVPGGLSEDAKAYADAQHEWNGTTSEGIPGYLVGADYVKTFNQHVQKKNRINICVTLARPARLYVFLDPRLDPPAWVKAAFRDTGDRIGLDAFRNRRFPSRKILVGPGEGIDERFTIWECEVHEPGIVRLGANFSGVYADPPLAMYGIAAVPLDQSDASQPQ